MTKKRTKVTTIIINFLYLIEKAQKLWYTFFIELVYKGE